MEGVGLWQDHMDVEQTFLTMDKGRHIWFETSCTYHKPFLFSS